MILAAHQPNYLPWAGFFYKMARCDQFVLLDGVQYSRTSYTARCQIKGPAGRPRWLSVPVFKKGRYHQDISSVEVDNQADWQRTHRRSLESCYRKAPHFQEILSLIEPALDRNWGHLAEMNTCLIKAIAQSLMIRPTFCRLSDAGLETGSSQMLVDLCLKYSANVYLSGPGGRRYLDEALFARSGIELRFVNYHSRPYPQLWGDFVPGLSVVDMLFNCGLPAARRMVGADGD